MKTRFQRSVRTIIPLWLAFLFALPVAGQQNTGQVDIKISILPPYSSKIADYASRPQQVLLLVHNLSNIALDIQLRGTITGDNGIVLRVDPQYRSPSPLHLNGGETRNLNGSDISQLFDYNQLIFSGISKNDAIRSNGLPEGNYQVCVEAYGYTTNQPLSSAEPMGCSNVFPVNSLETPIILSPVDGQSISAQTTQNFPITWSTPAGAPPSIQYTVAIVEILDNRSPNDAMNTASSPLFFQQTVNAGNLLLYGPSMPALTPGRTYAMMVVAKDPFNTVIFRNGGRSEVIGFVYGEPPGPGEAGGIPGNTDASNIPTATVKGRISWYYRKSEETPPMTISKYDPSKNPWLLPASVSEKMVLSAALTDPSFVAAVKPAVANTTGPGNPRGTYQATLISLKSAKPTAPIVPSTSNQLMKWVPGGVSILGGDMNASANPNNPAFFNDYGSVAYPLSNTVIKLFATDTSRPAYSSMPILVGTAVTDGQGNFQLSFVPPSTMGNINASKYTLSTENNYFSLPGFSFSLPANSTSYDAGDLKAFANTYRFLPFVVDESDSEIVAAAVSVYRRSDFYATHPNFQSEGNNVVNNRTDTTIGGQSYSLVSRIGDGHTGTRLFYSGGSDDEYQLVTTADRFSSYSSSLLVNSVLPNPSSPETVQQTAHLVTKPTTLSGQVYEQTDQSGIKRGIAGASVTLYLTQDAYQQATQVHESLVMVPGSMPQGISVAMNKNAVATQNNPAVLITGQLKNSGNGYANPRTGVELVNGINQYLRGNQITVTTDSSGFYSIPNIPVNPNEMKIVAQVPASSLTRTDSVLVSTKGAQLPPVNFPFVFKSYAVTGRVVDEKNNPVPNALYVWASGGSENQADSNGYLVSSNKAGNDTLIIRKLGFAIKRLPVHIAGDVLDQGSSSAGNSGSKNPVSSAVSPAASAGQRADLFFASLQNTGTYQQSIKKGTPISASGFGFIPANSSTNARTLAKTSWVSSLLGSGDKPSGAVDLGSIVLKKEIGRMLIWVTDENHQPLANAQIRIDGLDSAAFTTDISGKRYIEGPEGALTLDLSGPAGSAYAPIQVSITVSDQDTTKDTVVLAAGVIVSGTVKANGLAVKGANVGVDGLDYIQTVSDPNGNYSLNLSKNTSYTLKASQTGYVSDIKTGDFSANTQLDFTLTTASFNISSLLGFPVQIDQIGAAAGTHKKLTGSFVNLPANPLFSLKSGTRIPFTDIEVDIQGGIPVPIAEVINTDITSLALKAFNFLPINLTNNGAALIVRKTGTSGNAGQIEGFAAIDYSSFVPDGIAPYVDASVKQYLSSVSSATPQSIPVITSSPGAAATSLSLAGSNPSFNLYGFTVTLNLSNSQVKADGLHLKGSISLNNIPLISNTTLVIQDLWIGTNGYVSNVSVSLSPAPTIQIATWSGSLTGLSFNDNGFSVSGNIQVQLPSSQTSSIDFANLNISTEQLFGGSFTIPSTGIDVFGIVKFLGGSTPLSFGKLGSSNVYYIGGSGSVQFPALFDNLSLQFFQVQTDGQFAATVPVNINENFLGLANVQVTDIGFHTIGGIGVDIEGNFLFNAIPWLKASVGGVHFGTGGSLSVDDIGLSFDLVGVAGVKADIKFVNQPDKKGFAGDGSITIIGLPGAEIGFSYFKLPGGISVSANFKANISIPVGAIVSINNPGGGFSLNTADGTWSVNINGQVSATGLGTAVNIQINVTVTNGPVITGTAGLSVITINLANAAVCLDVPKSLFTININASIDLIPKVITSEGSAIFTLSAAKNDSYFMIAAQYQSSLLGIFNERVHIAAGWGLNVNNHPEYSEYTSFIDPRFLDQGVLKGISLNASSNIGFKATGSIYIASGSIWYKNNGAVNINMGIGAGNYGLDVSASWDCGASISVAPFGQIASVDIGSDVGIHLDYSNGCFSAGGDLAAHLSASIGDCDDDCFTGICTDYDIPSGGKICTHPGLHIGYDCNSGFSFGIDL